MGIREAVAAGGAVLRRRALFKRGGGPRAEEEILLGLALFLGYVLVTMLPEQARARAARENGERVLRLEQALRIDVEPALNRWLAERPALRVLANHEYAITYVASTLATLTWLFVRRPERYRTARNAFAMMTLGSLACFVLFPVMPPRLMPDLGFVDTVCEDRTWGSWGSPLVEHADQYAAVPSLHMAWTLWVGAELARVKAKRWVQWMNAAHMLVTLYVILATANHFLVDAIAAVPFVAVPMYLADRNTADRTAADRTVRP